MTQTSESIVGYLQCKFSDDEVSREDRHFRQFIVSDFSEEEGKHYISNKTSMN